MAALPPDAGDADDPAQPRAPARALARCPIVGIAFAVAVLVVGFVVHRRDGRADRRSSSTLAMRQDATVTLRRAAVGRARARRRAPAGRDGRRADARRAGPPARRPRDRGRSRSPGCPARTQPEPRRRSRRAGVDAAADGLVLSQMLGEILGVVAGRPVRVEVLEGRRPVRDVPVAALVDDSMGLQAYMRHRRPAAADARRRTVITGAAVTLDPAATDRFYADGEGACRPSPAWRCATVTLQNFRDTMAENMNLQIFFNVLFAGDHRLRRRLQLGARVAVGAEPRAGQPARARLHARRDLAHPARRAGDPDAGGAAGRRAHRLRASAG